MLSNPSRPILGAVVALILSAPGAQGESPQAGSAAAAEARRAAIEADTAAVRERIKQSADFLAAKKHFSFSARNDFQVLQRTSRMLEFGGYQVFTVRRPDRLRVDREDRDGDRRTTFFDGKTLFIDLPDADAYVAIEKPGSLDAVLDYIVDDLDTPIPLHEFLTKNFLASVEQRLTSGFFVATEEIGDEICDHVAFRTPTADVELWIRVGDAPLPCRIVIRYVTAEGKPQFTASFESWDFALEVPDELFQFKPPATAERLTFQAAHKEIQEDKELP